ncbi:MAG: outer membrane beta-barrel protein [Chitinophagaceae bacterium]
MRKLFSAVLFTTICSAFSLAASAQGLKVENANDAEITKPSRDFLMLQFTYEGWTKTPDSVKTGGLGRGFNAYICYDFPIQKSHLSFAAGVGVGSANIYFKGQELGLTDTGAAGAQVSFKPQSQDYKKYKINTTYLEAPFELRYFGNLKNRNKGFKAAIGLRAGILVGAHVKDSRTVGGTKVVEKIDTKRYLDKYRFSGTVRAGYGNFSLFGSYDLSAIFKEGLGPGIVPYSV